MKNLVFLFTFLVSASAFAGEVECRYDGERHLVGKSWYYCECRDIDQPGDVECTLKFLYEIDEDERQG